MKFLFACGGTAGHINPAIAVANRLKELLPDSEFLFVGAEGKMESQLIPREGYSIRTIKVSGLRRSFAPSEIVYNIRTIKNLAVSFSQAKAIIRDFKPDIAIGTGGYVCYPVLRKAAQMDIPTVVHESNALPGLTTKMLSDKVDKIMVGFDESRNVYSRPEKVEVTGTPVRGEFLNLDRKSARADLGVEQDMPLVVSFWGSLGASNMNRIMGDFIKLNNEKKSFRHIHATGGGERGLEEMKKLLEEKGVKGEAENGIDIRPYIYDMPKVMAAADLILCRGGASTLSELAVLGRAAVIVPSPYVTNNHQESNARALEKAGGAKVILEKECTGEKLFSEVRQLIHGREGLNRMSADMKKLGQANATDNICNIILDLLKG